VAVGVSRSTAFVAAARDWAGPDGFDVVLNALGPEIAAASTALLRPDGTFLEIGNAPPSASPHPIRHIAYDLLTPMAEDPYWFADRMARILELVRDGRLPPPRRTVLPAAQAQEALRALGQGATIGKLILRFPQPLRLHRDGTYLVTGGTGGIGRTLAGRLAAGGAGRVVLAARHPSADADFESVAVDIADAAGTAALLRGLPGLRGVIHAAGATRDRTIDALDDADIREATAAKIAGAINLDELTREQPLDFFVMISSSAGTLAAPGQAAYAGANSWVDRFAASRRAAGLQAVAIASGPWRTGMFARLDAASRRRIEADGYRAMAPHRAAAAMIQALEVGVAHRLVMDRTPAKRAETPLNGGIRAGFFGAPIAERAQLVCEELARQLAALLGLPTGTRVDPKRALRDLGLDSLLSVSLRNELAATLGLDLPSTLLFDYPTLETLSTFLLDQLAGPEAPLEALDQRELVDLLQRELGTAL
jgi:NAD(P)-dependent dehydrogenase (short-subunit alcohol dehydrogenase family)